MGSSKTPFVIVFLICTTFSYAIFYDPDVREKNHNCMESCYGKNNSLYDSIKEGDRQCLTLYGEELGYPENGTTIFQSPCITKCMGIEHLVDKDQLKCACKYCTDEYGSWQMFCYQADNKPLKNCDPVCAGEAIMNGGNCEFPKRRRGRPA